MSLLRVFNGKLREDRYDLLLVACVAEDVFQLEFPKADWLQDQVFCIAVVQMRGNKGVYNSSGQGLSYVFAQCLAQWGADS